MASCWWPASHLHGGGSAPALGNLPRSWGPVAGTWGSGLGAALGLVLRTSLLPLPARDLPSFLTVQGSQHVSSPGHSSAHRLHPSVCPSVRSLAQRTFTAPGRGWARFREPWKPGGGGGEGWRGLEPQGRRQVPLLPLSSPPGASCPVCSLRTSQSWWHRARSVHAPKPRGSPPARSCFSLRGGSSCVPGSPPRGIRSVLLAWHLGTA